MDLRSRVTLAACAAGAVLAFATAGPAPRVVAQEGGHHGHGTPAGPAELFRQRCASCHVAPDPVVATDRAWIRQLQETA